MNNCPVIPQLVVVGDSYSSHILTDFEESSALAPPKMKIHGFGAVILVPKRKFPFHHRPERWAELSETSIDHVSMS